MTIPTPDPYAARTTFYFFPPVDNAAAWNLNLDDFSNRILQAFPGATTAPEGQLGPTEVDSLSYEIPLGQNVWLDGLATTPHPGMGSVTARMASADEAAVFARWLRDTIAPARDLVHYTSELAVNSGMSEYQQIPADGDAHAIAEALQAHLDAFE